MADRTEKIRADLESAEASAKAKPRRSWPSYQRQLADARNEASQIIETARADAEAGAPGASSPAAETEAAELKARANDDIRLATERAHGRPPERRSPTSRSSWPRRSSSATSTAETQTAP